MDRRTAVQIAAQIAVEAVINSDPDTYTLECVSAVISNGRDNGVPEFYLNMLTER